MAASAAHPATPGRGCPALPALPAVIRFGRFSVARGVLVAVGGSIALGALSLLLIPSTPAYDPWSWIGWGRQIAHGTLSTSDGPSWKPFPVLFTAPFALFGGAAPALWLVVARAGALLAALLAFRLGRRLAGAGGIGVLAGILAALALVFSTGFLRQPAVGNSEGILIAFVLLAVERHLDGRHRAALVAGVFAGLLRPETWLFWGVYALWLARRDPESRRLCVGLGVGLLALWLVPEWLGSGNPVRAATRASEPEKTSLAFAAHPASAVIETARGSLMTWVRVAVLLAAVLGGLAASRGRTARAVRILLWLVAAAVAWDMVVALMTWSGFAGNPRYLMGATALFCVAGAAAAGLLLRESARRARPLAALLAVALAAVAGVQLAHRTGSLGELHDNLAFQVHLRHELPEAITAAGGRRVLLGCGSLAVEKFSRPLVSWYLNVPIERLPLDPASPGYLLAAQPARDGGYFPHSLPGSTRVAEVGPWRVLSNGCPAG